jgi:hypothetical protein
MADTIKYDELYMCAGCFCCNALLYIDFPDCFGTSCKYKCCCIEHTSILCKGDSDNKMCRCFSSDCNIVMNIFPLCKCMQHCCCSVSTCAIPNDESTPLTFGLCYMCFPQFLCCPKQKDMVRA